MKLIKQNKERKIEAWAVMNQNEENGHEGVLWFTRKDEERQALPLQIYSEEKQAERMAGREGLYKVVPCQIVIDEDLS